MIPYVITFRMKKIKTELTQNREFGKRLAQIRKAKGFSQYTLAEALGVSNRMVAYYEAQTNFPPAHLLPKLSKILEVSTDELLGIKSTKGLPLNGKLYKKLKQAEKLPPKAQKKIMDFIEMVEVTEKQN